MKRLILIFLFFLPLPVLAQNYILFPTVMGEGGTYQSKLFAIQSTKTYTWIVTGFGPVHVVVKAKTVFHTDTSGYVVLDSAYRASGFVHYTVSITGDSLMRLWIPDDAGGLGAAGTELKTRSGWQAKLIIEAKSGSGGKLAIAESAPTAYTVPSDPSLYVTTDALTDSLNLICRTCGGGSGIDTSGAWLEAYINKIRDTSSVANRQAWTADGKAVSAQSTASTATSLAHQAMTRARIDSVLVTSGTVDLTATDAVHPSVIVATDPAVKVYLPDVSGVNEYLQVLLVNASSGDVLFRYSGGQDPDGGTDDDTVARAQWQIVVADPGNAMWHVIRPGGSTDTTGFFAAYGGVMVESDPFINDSLDRNPRIPTMLRGMPVVSVMEFVRSDTSHSWTQVFQNALDSCKGKILYVPAGTYEFAAQGECPYEAGKEYVLDLKTGNVSLWVSPGATLKLNAGLQVDSAVNFLVWKDARDIFIGGGGTIMLNASNQPGWVTGGGATWASDNGYCQGEAGNIIDGYQTGTEYDMSSNITVENLTLKDCFSNPIDIHGASHSMIRNIRSWSFGEGPQFVRGLNVVMDNIFVSDKHEPPYWTAGGVGDGIEAASCVDFVISNCVIRDYQVTGHIDISYSSRGTVTGCVVDSAGGLLETQSPLGNYYSDDITISNCVVKKPGTHGIWWMSPGSATILGVLIDSVKSGAAGIYVVNNRRPVYISGCTIRNASYGIFTSNGLIEVTGCSFDSTERGVAIWRGGASEAPVVNIAGSIFRDCSVAGVEVNAGGEVDYDARGSVVGSSFKNCPYMPIRFPNAADADSLNFFYQYHDVDGNKLRTNMLTWGTDSTVIATQGYVETRLSGYATTTVLSDTASARALAVGDSLLAMRGFVRSAIADTLVKYSYGIMAGDTAALGKVLDAMYPRSGGGSVDTARLWPGFTNQDISYNGHIKLKSTVADTVASFWNSGMATAALYRDALHQGIAFGKGARIVERTTTGILRVFLPGGMQYIPSAGQTIHITGVVSQPADSAFTVGEPTDTRGIHIYGGGLFHGGIGTGGQAPRIGRRLDVVGAAAVSDTLRVGDFTTFTYVVPGGDPVKSSTADIKTDISAIETPADFEARILAVSPKRYRFKPEAYLRGVSDTLKGKALTKALAEDAAQAAKQSERVMTGFIAEEFNPAFGIDPASKEIHTSDIIAAQWKAIQMLTARVKALEARLTKLEGAR